MKRLFRLVIILSMCAVFLLLSLSGVSHFSDKKSTESAEHNVIGIIPPNTPRGTTTVFSEDFEGAFPSGGSWTVGDSTSDAGADYWDDTSYRYYGGSWSGWCAMIGDNSYYGGTNYANHKYDNYMDAYMYKSVSLGSYSSATLSYYYWLDSENTYDELYVIYYSGGSWSYVDMHTGNSGGWQYSSVSIPTSATYVGLHFYSDSSVCSYEGAYIDNVVLTAVTANSPPNTPSTPSGPTSGTTGTSYTYSTSATDPDGDNVKYTFDWGDATQTTTAFVASGTSASASHSWSSAGTYYVDAYATDINGATSGWSSALTVTITVANSPPNTPSTPSGPTSGYTGTSYTYSTSATDPNGDNVKYTFDWGDATQTTTAFVASGTSASAAHSWSSAGTYYVDAYATDINGATSGWSSALTVTITATVSLGEAVDNTALTWTTGGNANWFGQTTTYYNGADAAQSGDIADSQSTYIQTTVTGTGTGTLTFWWKVSSESGYDYLRFYIDETEQTGSISGEVSWAQKSFSIASGLHTLKWAFTKDGSTSSGSDCGWLDYVVYTVNTPPPVPTLSSPANGATGISTTPTLICNSVTDPNGDSVWYYFEVDDNADWSSPATLGYAGGAGDTNYVVGTDGDAKTLLAGTKYYWCVCAYDGKEFSAWSSVWSFTTAVSLGEAVDNTALTWTTGGNANWFGQTTTYYNGGDAAQSSDIADSQSTYIQTTVASSGTLTFWWKVSSESGYDYLRFYIDGTEQSGSISGEVSWAQKSFSIASGSHTLKWNYTKDGSTSSGSDCGWLDYVVFTANTPPPTPTLSSPANGATGISTTPTLICNSVTDPNGDAVSYYFIVDDNADWSSPATQGYAGGAADTNYVVGTDGDANTLVGGTTYYWCVCAYDGKDFSSWSSAWSFTTATPNSPPNTPSTPSGPTSGVTGTSYTYSTSATDPDGNNVKYTFDWGDATTTTTAFVASGTSASAAHSWNSAGTYYVKAYATDSNGASSGWSSSLTITITINLGEAVDNTALSWTTGGDANWFGETTTYYYGNDAAQSSDISDNQNTYIQTTVTGPGTLKFYWKVSSESNYDYLRFYIDGAEQTGSISGEVDWTQQTYSISSGSHTLQWKYTKDGSESPGGDCGWLDKVEFSGAVNSPPTASFTYSPTAPTTADTIQFTDTSTDSDGTITAWSWNFGDGGTSTAQNPTHKYTSAGTYTVTLTVTDNGGATNSTSKSIAVTWGGGGALGLVYVLVTDSVYSSIQSNITTYKSDLENEGYTVGIYNGSWTTISSVRTILQNGLSSGLVGAVLVGNIPIAWYKLKDPDSWGLGTNYYETFPIELYYMDLDGTWSPGSGTQTDPFTDHTGNTAPEIWVGRLYASTAGGTEVTLLKNYFYKNHLYRTGGLSLPQKALVYVDDDWYSLADQWNNDVGLLYTNRTLVKDQETTTATDYKNRLTTDYQWVSLFSHSGDYYHALKYNSGASWSYVYNTEITTVNPHASFYNLYCCHGANYSYGSDNGYIGGHYIFGNTYGLMAVGSTKTGSMLNFDDFYSPLGNGKTIGNAFKDWYTLNGETGVTDARAWFYGMTVLGDPTLKPSSSATDTTPPTGSASINSGATYTTTTSVTLTLSANDAETGVLQMCFSNDGTTYTAWETYATSKSWTLTTGDGTKTVYVKYKNGAGLDSSAYSDTIILDTTAPTGSISINSGATYTTSTSVTLTLSGSDATSGVSQTCFSNDGTTYTAWEAYATSKSWSLTTGDGTKTVYVKYKDNAGLISSAYSDTIMLDTTAPTGSIVINDGDAYTTSTSVKLTLSASDATSGVSQTCFSNDGTTYTAWEAYGTSKSWTLTSGEGSKTVYVKYKDNAGLVSTGYSDTIVLDASAPTGSIVINSGNAYTISTSVTLTLSASDASGVAQMCFSNDGTTYTAWEAYATSKSWTLTTGDSSKTVYAKYKDNAGLESSAYSDTITLDTTAPTSSVSALPKFETTTSFTVSWSGADATSGIASYDTQYKDGSTGIWTNWLTATTLTSSTFTGTDGHIYYFQCRATDGASNIEVYPGGDGDTSTTIDTTAPTGSIVINSGNAYTTSTSVTLTLSASDSTSGVSQMCFSNDGTTYTAWEAYATSKSWTLTSGDGTKTVYVKYNDGAGLVSSACSDTIILDTIAPTITSTTPSNNAVNVSLTQNITIQFSEEMNTSSVQYTCFPNPSGWASSWNAAKDTLTLAHNEFSPGVTYTFNITVAKDVAGNNLVPGPVSNPWTFTTGKVVKFDFQQGSNSFTLPFVSSTIKDAESLANAIGKNCTGIAYWDNALGRFITHLAGTDISNFNIVLGVGYMVFVSGKTVFTFAGESKINSVTMSLGAGWNSIGRFNETTTTAETIGSTISNCTHIAKWNATSQSFDVYVVGSGVNNFNIEQGDMCLVYVTKGSQWVNQ